MSAESYWLSHHAFVCSAQAYCVFLDLRRDKYLCTDRAAFEALMPHLKGRAQRLGDETSEVPAEAAKLAQELLAIDLLTTDQTHGKAADPIVALRPHVDLVHENERLAASLNPFRILRFFIAATRAARALKRQPLEQTVTNVRRRKERVLAARGVSEADWDHLESLVRSFLALRSYFPRNYLCLFDSLALVEFLADYNYFPDWIFGVQGEPFEAHCWVQSGDTVLNDTAEHIRPFTPIMAV